MEQSLQAGSIAGIMVIAGILAIVTMILWIIMPFVILNIKKRVEESNELLRQIHKELEKLNGPRE